MRFIASSREILSAGKSRISCQFISRIVFPVMLFLTAPKSFDFLLIGQFYLMVYVAVSLNVVVQNYNQEAGIATITNHIVKAVNSRITGDWCPGCQRTLPDTLQLKMVRFDMPKLVDGKMSKVICGFGKVIVFRHVITSFRA